MKRHICEAFSAGDSEEGKSIHGRGPVFRVAYLVANTSQTVALISTAALKQHTVQFPQGKAPSPI